MGTKRIILQNAPSRKGENNCRVFERHPDGRISNLGFVPLKYFRHLRMSAWEATGTDGHRAVHEHHWQAVWALTWDETAPHSRSRRIVCGAGPLTPRQLPAS